jgi:acetamidase/formamidase
VVHLTRDTTHTVWDRSIEPVTTVQPGDTVTFEVANSSGGQIERDSSVEAVRALDFSAVNPVTGPVRVEGAAPGDVLVVELLDIDVEDWGWTANIPGFGLLADDFPDAHLAISTVADGRVRMSTGVELQVVPMVGTIGVAPPEPGEHSIVPPRRWGGNMDIRHVTAGATLRLPVGVDGALFSLGDTHAAQGDGEVCGTGIEIGSQVTVRLDLEKRRELPTPVLLTDARAGRAGPALAVTGIRDDLYAAARDACRYLVDEVSRRTGLDPVDAYLLASVSADMTVSEIVDVPNWVVSMHLPLPVLEGR